MDFAVDGKPHAQIMELLPRSMETQPLYASLAANQLFVRFWILPEETFAPQGGTARADRPEITPRDSLTMRWDQWLHEVDADMTTEVYIRKQKVLEERIRLKAQAKGSSTLPTSEKRRLLSLFDPDKRREVSPWDPLEPPSFEKNRQESPREG